MKKGVIYVQKFIIYFCISFVLVKQGRTEKLVEICKLGFHLFTYSFAFLSRSVPHSRPNNGKEQRYARGKSVNTEMDCMHMR